jgi:predicted nucleic acid-binding protein
MAETVRYLLDTSAILAHYRREAGADEVQALFEADEAELMIASLTLTELGRRLRELGASESDVERVLSEYELLFNEVVPLDAAISKEAFAIGCRTPRRLPLADALVAAAAQARDAVLVHRDEHMRPLPAGLVRQRELAVGSSRY